MIKNNQFFIWAAYVFVILGLSVFSSPSYGASAYDVDNSACDFNVQFTQAPVCEGTSINVIVRIDEKVGVENKYTVFLDSTKVNQVPQSIEGDFLVLQAYVLGNGRTHTLTVKVDGEPECTYIKEFKAINCFSYCPNSDLKVYDYSQNSIVVDLHTTRVSPALSTFFIGDRITLKAQDDGVRYVSKDPSFPWDTGVMQKGDTYPVLPKKEGYFEYASFYDDSVRGHLKGTCSGSKKQSIRIQFANQHIHPEGYSVHIDGFDLGGFNYPYDSSGITTLTYDVVNDGKPRTIEIVDARTNCKIQSAFTAVDCGNTYPCRLRLESKRLSRCDFDKVDYSISGYSINEIAQNVELYRNGHLLDRFRIENQQFQHKYALSSTGATDTIVIYHEEDFQCNDTLYIRTQDCSEKCEYIRLELEGESLKSSVIRLEDTQVSEDVVYNEVGQQVYFSFATENQLGVRYNGSDSLAFDSGLQTLGFVYIPYLLPVGQHEIEVYNEAGDVLYIQKIYVAGYFEDPNLSITYTLTDKGGSSEGYDVYIDDEKYNSYPLQYSIYGDTKGRLLLKGDDRMHTIRFVDCRYPEVVKSIQYYLPAFRPSICNKKLRIIESDTCYNDDYYDISVEFTNKSTYGDGFYLWKDGKAISSLISYDSLGTGQFQYRIKGDSRKSEFTATDSYDLGCSESIVYGAKECTTPCLFSGIKVQEVDQAYYDAHPSTPLNFVGCVDSTIYYAVSFYEKYSDGTVYNVLLDDEAYSAMEYNEGDGLNTFFIPMDGDGKFHEVKIVDMVDTTCKISKRFKVKECYDPCHIDIEKISSTSCNTGIASYEIQLSEATTQADYKLLVEDKPTTYVQSDKTLKFSMAGDGNSYNIKLASSRLKDSLCFDHATTTTPYCMPCNYTASASLYEACTEDTMAIYVFRITSFTSDIVRIRTPREEIAHNLIEDGQIIYFKLFSDGTEQVVTILPVDDSRCSQDIIVKTEDCTPRVCSPSYTYAYDGMNYIFRDASTATDSIIKSSWMIDAKNSGTDDVLSYTFDKAGTYEVCRIIQTAYCQEQSCQQINVENPCTATVVSFEYKLLDNRVIIENTEAEQFDFITYDFGDGTIKNAWNPEHTYEKDGNYTVCAKVEYAKYNCNVNFCVDIKVGTHSTVDPLSSSITLYPNPLQRKSTLVATGVTAHAIDKIEFVDANGRIYSGKYTIVDEKTIHIAHEGLTAGVYILRIALEQGVAMKKVIIL